MDNINNNTDSLLNKLKEDSVSYKNLETSSLSIKEKKKAIRSRIFSGTDRKRQRRRPPENE